MGFGVSVRARIVERSVQRERAAACIKDNVGGLLFGAGKDDT
jgi:hypothetical protein